MLTFQEKETDAKTGEVDISKEVNKSLKLGFDRHEDVKRILGSAKILLEGEAEEFWKRSSLRDEGRRDATEKGARMRSLPNSDRSERERAGPMRVEMRPKQGLAGSERDMRRLEN